MYVRFPLSLRNVEDLLFERGIDVCHETVRFWWNRFGPLFAGDIRRQRVSAMCGFRDWRWHLDEVYVKINGEQHYLWRAVDHEGEVLESYVTKTRDKAAALRFMKKALKRHGSPETITTDGLRFYGAAMDELGNREKQEVGRYANNRVENLTPAVPTTRAGYAEVQANALPAEVRKRPRQRPQPLQPRTPTSSAVRPTCIVQRTVRVGRQHPLLAHRSARRIVHFSGRSATDQLQKTNAAMHKIELRWISAWVTKAVPFRHPLLTSRAGLCAGLFLRQ